MRKGDKYKATWSEWTCTIESRASRGTVLVRWTSGPLKGKEARVLVSDIRKQK